MSYRQSRTRSIVIPHQETKVSDETELIHIFENSNLRKIYFIQTNPQLVIYGIEGKDMNPICIGKVPFIPTLTSAIPTDWWETLTIPSDEEVTYLSKLDIKLSYKDPLAVLQR